MTGRYALFQTNKLTDRFGLADGLPRGVKPRYNVSPTQTMPVIVMRDGKPQAELMKWGFVPAGAKDMNAVFRYKTFGARTEDVFDKPTWSPVIRTQRCLVPANGFYEWETTSDGKQPYFVHLPDNALFAMAGIYSNWQDPDGTEWGTYAIVTLPASDTVRGLASRMPVILPPGSEASWLDTENTDMNTIYDLMRPYTGAVLVDKVNQAVNSAKVDKPYLIDAVE
jgi:putative SOS response-associated peptidase YedK